MKKHYKNYFLKYIHFFILGAIVLIMIDVLQLEIPKIVGTIFDGLNGELDYEFVKADLIDNVIKIGVLVLIVAFGRFFWRIFFLGTSRKIEYDIRERLFDKCLKFMPKFYSKNKIGNLMAYFTNDLTAVRNLYGQAIMMIIDVLFVTTLTIFYMVQISWKLTLVAMIPILMLPLINYFLGKRVREGYKNQQKSFASMSDFVQESLSGISVTKSFATEKTKENEFEGVIDKHCSNCISVAKLSNFLSLSSGILASINVILVLMFGGYLVLAKNDISTGDLVAFVMYIGVLMWPMRAIAQAFILIAQGRASLNRINNLLEDEEVYIEDNQEFDFIFNESIEFKNLSYKYGEIEVLKDISFEIKKGEFVGIVGAIGCGKTTIMELLLRLYEIDDGQIFIDGIDINYISRENLRDKIAYVLQDVFLFSDTIEQNIKLNVEDNDLKRVLEVSRDADIESNILDFKDGYNTVIGERGVTLSGGQKQRLSLARALYKESELLILDDSFSAIDTQTEQNILKKLNEKYSNRTKIVIAHRISTILNANKIIFMEDGKIIDIGTHKYLYENCDKYRALVEKQDL